ncbi:MAG TPA: TraR/DksA C4-type zinc finger protein [Arenibaculum sp.]|nr:TraR/DksA C4-type zinc finger protein [Arenibaculum sp.]
MKDEPQIDVEAVRAKLLARLGELDDMSRGNREARAPVQLDQASVGRLSRMDAMQGQAMALEAERRRVTERRRIEQALRRMDEDEYGWCAKCGEPIGAKRLELDPAIAICINCAR